MSTALDPRLISSVYDAALDPQQWPNALRRLTDFFGSCGAGFVIRNKRRDLVDWACFIGPLETRSADYVDYYSNIDLYLALVQRTPVGHWCRLSHSLPRSQLQHSEWYNDFMHKSGVDDLIGIKLHDGETHAISFGFQKSMRTPFKRRNEHLLREVNDQLCRAARIQYQLRTLGWKSTMTTQALDRLSVGVVLVDGESRVMEMTQVADRILAAGDGLFVQNSRLRARRAFEAAKLDKLIAAATRNREGPTAGRMVVARGDGRASCSVTVVPVDPRLTMSGRAAAMILLVDPESQVPSEAVLSDVYGLSPAEMRLAAALMKGKSLDAIADENGVRMTTLRTQLSSVLRKVGVKRQAELVRVLSGIHVVE